MFFWIQIQGKGCFYSKLTLLLMNFSEVYQIVSLFCTFHLTLLLITDLCARWYILSIPLTSTVLFKFFHVFFKLLSQGSMFLKKSALNFLPISIFYPFFCLPFFLSSFIILQNTTIYSLSSALDAFQSDFLCFHTDTILTSLANDKYISKNLPLLCLQHLQRTILIISIIMAKHFIQTLMYAALISKGFSKVQSLPSSVHINHCFGFCLHCMNVWMLTLLISYVHWLPVQSLFDLENILILKGLFVSSPGSHPLSVFLVSFLLLSCLSIPCLIGFLYKLWLFWFYWQIHYLSHTHCMLKTFSWPVVN